MKQSELYVTKVLYEKNASDGLDLHKGKQALAEAVLELEATGGRVQVYKCVPVQHEAYTERAGIHLSDEGEA